MIVPGLSGLGRFSARRPWVVIGSWVLLAVVVVAAASSFGHKLEDSFRVPGLDSQKANDLQAHSTVRVEMGGDLLFAFDQSAPGLGEAVGLLAAAVILFLAFGSLVATALPIGIALFGLAVGVSSMSLLARLVDVPDWAP